MTAPPNEPGYWYLHTNGSRIFKPKAVVDWVGGSNYFSGPFCVRWWPGTRDDNRTPEEKAPVTI